MLDESGGPLAKAGADMMGGEGGSIGPPTTHPISLPASQVSQKKITKTANQIYKIMEQIEELVCLHSTKFKIAENVFIFLFSDLQAVDPVPPRADISPRHLRGEREGCGGGHQPAGGLKDVRVGR